MGRSHTVRLLALGTLLAGVVASLANAQADSPAIGRWDLTVADGSTTYPSWVEVSLSRMECHEWSARSCRARMSAGGHKRALTKVGFRAAQVSIRIDLPGKREAAWWM